MLLAIAGFAIIFAMIYLLFRGKTTPVDLRQLKLLNL